MREALTRHYEITRIARPLLEMLAIRTGDEPLARVSAPDANGELTKFLWGRQIIDLLLAHPGVKPSPAEFVVLLRNSRPAPRSALPTERLRQNATLGRHPYMREENHE